MENMSQIIKGHKWQLSATKEPQNTTIQLIK